MKDLRYMTAETHEQFNDIVIRGLRADRGMPAFADKYNEQDAEAVHAFIIKRANEDYARLSR